MWERTVVRVPYDDLGDQPGPLNQVLVELGGPSQRASFHSTLVRKGCTIAGRREKNFVAHSTMT